MAAIIVRGIVGSPFMRAVLTTLIEKSAEHRLERVPPGQHKAPAYLALHPFGRVPVIEDDGFVLYETQAILRYLDRTHPTPPLTPVDPKLAARMDQAMNITDWYVFRLIAAPIIFNRIVAPRVGAPVNEAAVIAALPEARVCFDNLEAFLGERAYLAGETLTLADLHLAPHIDMLADCPEGAEMLAGTRLAAWLDRIRARPSFAATSWDRLAAG